MMKCLSTLIHSLNTYFTSFYFQNLKKQKYLFTSIVLRSSSYSTKIALKWTKIMLQSSVIPIWNPQNQGYKIGNIYNYWDQPWSPKNGLEMLLRILSANTVCKRANLGLPTKYYKVVQMINDFRKTTFLLLSY